MLFRSLAPPVISSFTGGESGLTAVLLVLNGLSWALGYTGQPQLLSRMIALKNKKDVTNAKWVASLWTIVAYIGAILSGLVGYFLMKGGVLGAEATKVSADAEQILPTLVVTLVNPILAGILLSGVVSADRKSVV